MGLFNEDQTYPSGIGDGDALMVGNARQFVSVKLDCVCFDRLCKVWKHVVDAQRAHVFFPTGDRRWNRCSSLAHSGRCIGIMPTGAGDEIVAFAADVSGIIDVAHDVDRLVVHLLKGGFQRGPFRQERIFFLIFPPGHMDGDEAIRLRLDKQGTPCSGALEVIDGGRYPINNLKQSKRGCPKSWNWFRATSLLCNENQNVRIRNPWPRCHNDWRRKIVYFSRIWLRRIRSRAIDSRRCNRCARVGLRNFSGNGKKPAWERFP